MSISRHVCCCCCSLLGQPRKTQRQSNTEQGRTCTLVRVRVRVAGSEPTKGLPVSRAARQRGSSSG
eukprot:357664-Chlamydomonas_euryale.AAC.4